MESLPKVAVSNRSHGQGERSKEVAHELHVCFPRDLLSSSPSVSAAATFALRKGLSISSIRFLGLFDTVNSVPRFENALMKRSKFPYTARSTAKVIRHAVAIDERRAKFRQDLISERKPSREAHCSRRHKYMHLWDQAEVDKQTEVEEPHRGRTSMDSHTDPLEPAQPRLQVPRFRDSSRVSPGRSPSPKIRRKDGYDGDSFVTSASQDSLAASRRDNVIWASDEDSDSEEQDIKEVWFPGCHAVRLLSSFTPWSQLTNTGHRWRLASTSRRRRSIKPRPPRVDGPRSRKSRSPFRSPKSSRLELFT